MARKLKLYPEVFIDIADKDEKLDFHSIFGRCEEVHIEIGSGKGTFLVNQASRHSNIDFLGIEWANKYYRHAVDRIGRWSLTNARLIRDDAAVFIREYISSESVDCFHVYFPDPWPKSKHHKRRFVSAENVEQMHRCLKTTGKINMATDHKGYFEWMCDVFAGFSGKLEQAEFQLTAGAQIGEFTGTNYERKYLKENKDIHRLAFVKI